MVLDFDLTPWLSASGVSGCQWPGDGRLQLEWTGPDPGNHPAELKWAPHWQSVIAAALGAAFTPSRLADTSVLASSARGAARRRRHHARSLASFKFTLDSEATPLSLSGLESRWPALSVPQRRRRGADDARPGAALRQS